MCRYSVSAYKLHYACFACRKTFKRRLMVDIDKSVDSGEYIPSKCPECAERMMDMGLDFESPKKKDVKAWKHLEDLYEAGITFHSCGCSGPGYIPKDKMRLLEFLQEKKETFIQHQRFWSNRETPETESERQRDLNKNSQFIFSIPNDLKTGTRKNRKVDLAKAVEYWTAKVIDIEKRISLVQLRN